MSILTPVRQSEAGQPGDTPPFLGSSAHSPSVAALIPASLRHSDPKEQARIYLRRPAVLAMTGVAASTWERWVRAGLAPRPRRLGPNCVAWRLCDIEAWCASRPQAEGRNHG